MSGPLRCLLAWSTLVFGVLFGSGCDWAKPEISIPERGKGLRGPVSPQPVHDLVSDNREMLGLSIEEERAIRKIADDAREELNSYHAQIDQRRAALSELLNVDTPDREAINRAVEALGAAETKLRRGELRVLLDIRARLSPAQRAALVRLSASTRPERRPGPPKPPPPRR